MSNKKNHGTPGRQFSPSGSRQPRQAIYPETEERLLFQWRTSHMDYDGAFGWEHLTVKDFCRNIVTFLQNLETMTWDNVYRKGSHSLSWDSLSKTANQRFDEIKDTLPDTFGDAELLSIPIKGVPRIIGFRDRACFYLLWWDPSHNVSPSSKKHT